MTNAERYRSAFPHAYAPADCVQQTLEQAQCPQDACRTAPKHRPLRRIIILAAAVAILTMTVGSELTNSSVSNLLAPLYGSAQTELADQLRRASLLPGYPCGL